MSAELPEIPHNEPVEAELRRQMQDGPIPFAKFMEVSLYGDNGYYSGGHSVIGPDIHNADFVTSPEVSPEFGATIGNFLAQKWDDYNHPVPFYVVEQGAGNGTLARDFLDGIHTTRPDFYDATRYVIVERSAGLIAVQQNTLVRQTENRLGSKVHWVNGNAYDFPFGSSDGTGVEHLAAISNELIDVFPVHRLIRRQGQVKEIYIGLDADGNFYETEGEISPSVDDPLFLDDVQEGFERTACPLAIKWVETVGQAMQRGCNLVIDYARSPVAGDHVPRVFTRFDPKASLATALQFPGSVDITASIDPRQILTAGLEVGLEPTEIKTQRMFLERYGFDAGLYSRVRLAFSRSGEPESSFVSFMSRYMRRAEQLVSGGPSGFGGFSVLVQEKRGSILDNFLSGNS